MACRVITSERIGDVPLLVYWLLKMPIDKIIDAVLGPPHGNWQGLSYGQLTVVFIAYILTECNHFLSPVRDWVLTRREGLSHALGQPIRDTDFTDDRLEALLDALGADEVGEQIEMHLGQHLIRAYALPTDTGRIDTTRYLQRGRHGPNSPFEMVTTTHWQLTIERQTEAMETFNRLAGWRLYVTNAPAWRLDLSGAVACYREQWQPERGFRRLKGVPLAIRPLLLRSDRRISGLLCILVIALRALTLLEFVARRSLEQQPEPLQGLYAGNPKRATSRPTAERLLKAFDGITLYRLSDGQTTWYEVTPLSALQRRILGLLEIPESVYTRLAEPLLASP